MRDRCGRWPPTASAGPSGGGYQHVECLSILRVAGFSASSSGAACPFDGSAHVAPSPFWSQREVMDPERVQPSDVHTHHQNGTTTVNQRLQQRLEKARKSDEGFTLIELLIVIVVLGILAGIVVFGVGTFKQDATKAAGCANKKSVEVASQAYIANKGTVTTNVADLVAAKYLQAEPNPAVTIKADGSVDMTGC